MAGYSNHPRCNNNGSFHGAKILTKSYSQATLLIFQKTYYSKNQLKKELLRKVVIITINYQKKRITMRTLLMMKKFERSKQHLGTRLCRVNLRLESMLAIRTRRESPLRQSIWTGFFTRTTQKSCYQFYLIAQMKKF